MDLLSYMMGRKSAGGGKPTFVPWATGTDEQIVAMIQAARNGDIDLQQDANWAVGDVRTIQIDAFTAGGNKAVPSQSVDLVITSFDEYNGLGNLLQFDFLTPITPTIRAGSGSQEYRDSEMKSTTLPNLTSAMPQYLQDLMLQLTVPCSYYSPSGITQVTSGKLATRSEYEVAGSNTKTYVNEGVHLPYYTAENRVKKLKNGSEGVRYWLRTASRNDVRDTAIINGSGNVSTSQTSYAGADYVAPFGCL